MVRKRSCRTHEPATASCADFTPHLTEATKGFLAGHYYFRAMSLALFLRKMDWRDWEWGTGAVSGDGPLVLLRGESGWRSGGRNLWMETVREVREGQGPRQCLRWDVEGSVGMCVRWFIVSTPLG